MVDEPLKLTDQERKVQRRRSIAIGAVLAVLVVIFYIVALIKMGSQL